MTESATAVTTLSVVQPAVPAKASQDEVAALSSKASEIVTSLLEKSDDRDYVAGIMNLGSEAQQKSSRKLELLKGRVGTMMTKLDGEGAKIPADLVKMRLELDKINPHVVEKAGFFSRLIGKVPGVGDRLKQIAVRYESVQTQIDAIVSNLREGRDELLRDNLSMEQLYDDLAAEQLNVQKNAYLGELLLQKLEEASPTVSDPGARHKLQNITHGVALRVQDLRTMEAVNNQFFLSIDMTCENNRLLSQSVDRTLTVTTNVITVGLAIAAALANQKQTLEATKATQEYAGNILAANAAAIRQQTTEIQSLYSDPVLALDKLTKGFDDLMAAMDEVEKAKATGIQKAKSGIAALSSMSRQLEEKVNTTRPEALPGQKSLEA